MPSVAYLSLRPSHCRVGKQELFIAVKMDNLLIHQNYIKSFPPQKSRECGSYDHLYSVDEKGIAKEEPCPGLSELEGSCRGRAGSGCLVSFSLLAVWRDTVQCGRSCARGSVPRLEQMLTGLLLSKDRFLSLEPELSVARLGLLLQTRSQFLLEGRSEVSNKLPDLLHSGVVLSMLSQLELGTVFSLVSSPGVVWGVVPCSALLLLLSRLSHLVILISHILPVSTTGP